MVAHRTHPMRVVEEEDHVRLLLHHYPEEAVGMILRKMVVHHSKDCIPQMTVGQKMTKVAIENCTLRKLTT